MKFILWLETIEWVGYLKGLNREDLLDLMIDSNENRESLIYMRTVDQG